MTIRKVTINDIDLLLVNRFEFLSLFVETFPENFKIATKEYLYTHIADNTLICYIAIENDVIVSSAMMCVYDVIPSVKTPKGKNGYLYNVYTKQEYRRQGLSSQIMKNIIDEAKLIGIDKIMLDFSDDGLKLYEKMGFRHLDRQMELNIHELHNPENLKGLDL
jgi:ribosomal protein S18 acetylase RimI-like enzyme